MRSFLFFLSFLLMGIILSAQSHTLSGRVVNKEGAPVFAASILITDVQDSTKTKGLITDEKGSFSVQLEAGKYECKVSFVGYLSVQKPFSIENKAVDLGRLALEKKTLDLGEVVISEKATPVIQRDDTTEFKAAAYKVNPDANVEDLVTKMPGVILQDGKVQAQGEQVKKVLVDGKPFLGDDPSAALKNLPADAVDKIQVYDGRSEQSQFTGFDDGNLIKTMNIITKDQYKKGLFGRAFGGVGYKDKWRIGGIANYFNQDERITFLMNNNNVNEQNFTMDDMSSMMGNARGGRRMMVGRGGGFGGGTPGIITTNMFGLNYSNSWNKVELSGSYFFNRSNTEIKSYTNRSYYDTKAGFVYEDTTQSKQISMNHRINFKIDWKIDSMNSILFEPTFVIQQSDVTAFSIGRNMLNGTQINFNSDDTPSNSSSFNGTSSILYRHRFHKKGRTLSLNFTPGYNETNGESNLNSTYGFWEDTIFTTEIIAQHANLNRKGYVFSGNATYTEPLSTTLSTLIVYQTNYNLNDSEKKSYDNVTSLLDTSLSNVFKSTYFSNSLGGNLRFQKEKFYLMGGISFQYASLRNDRSFPVEDFLKKDFPTLLPSAEFRYSFSKQENLRINYRSSNNIPSITQLQEVLDNSNTLQLSIGNSNLKQENRNSVNMNYSKTNLTKNTNFFAMLNATYTTDYIGNHTIIATNDTTIHGVLLGRGVQLKRPENFDNYYQMRSYVMYGFPITALKLNFNINGSLNYSKMPGMINSQLNIANNYGAGIGWVASSNISPKFDFTISSNTSFTFGKNSAQSAVNSKYMNENISVRVNVNPVGGLTMGTELVDKYYSGFEGNTKQNYILWNASIGYKFLKNRQLEVKVSVYDILDQNQSLSRNITEAYYEEVISNTLSRYLMFHIAWNFKSFSGQSPEPKRMQMGGGRPNMVRPD